MIDQMKTTVLDNWGQAERFVIYTYVTGSDDSGTGTAEKGSITDTASESEASLNRLHCLKWSTVLKCMR